MSRPRRLLAAFAVLLPLILSLAAAPATRASTSVAAPAPLLAGPTPDAGVLLSLEPGTELTIDGPPEGAYYPVTAVGVSGWIEGGMMRVDKAAASQPAPLEAPAPDPATGGEAPPAVVDADAPADSAPPAPVSSDDASGESGVGGESPAAEPSTAADEAEQPSTEPPAAESPAPAPGGESGGSAPIDPATTVTPEATAEPSPSPAPAEQAPPAEPSPAADDPDPREPEMRQNGPTTVLIDAPLLDAPEPHAGLVFTVPAGSTFNLYGDAANGYLYGEFMWMFGWIRADQLEPAERVREERVPTDVEEVDTRTPKAGAGTAWTTVDLTLRAGPSAAEDALGTVPAGTRVELTGVMQNDFQRVVHDGEVGWLSNEYLELPKAPEPEVKPNGRPEWTEREIIGIIQEAADRYGQPREDMLRVARCESNLDPYAVNPSGSYGLFQFVRSTWESTPFADKDIFDPWANANAAGWMWKEGRRSEWVCQ